VDIVVNGTAGLAVSLESIRRSSLGDLSASKVSKIVRRIVDHEAVTPRLDVAKFNSAI
jgi:hypothetical protein